MSAGAPVFDVMIYIVPGILFATAEAAMSNVKELGTHKPTVAPALAIPTPGFAPLKTLCCSVLKQPF